MKDRYIIAVLAVFLQIAVLVGCSGRESNSIEIASVNGEKILASDFDLAKAQYESKNMLDAELLDGLIKERIVLQYGEKIEDIITEETVTERKVLNTLIAESAGKIIKAEISSAPTRRIPRTMIMAIITAIIRLKMSVLVPSAFANSSSKVTSKIL